MNKIVFLFFAISISNIKAEDWPGWFGPERNGIWQAEGILDQFPENGPKVIWKTPIARGYTGPAVANGKVFVMDRQIDKGAKSPENPFSKITIPGNERLLCINAKVLHEFSRMTSVLCADQVNLFEDVDCSFGNIMQVTDRRGHNIEGAFLNRVHNVFF